MTCILLFFAWLAVGTSYSPKAMPLSSAASEPYPTRLPHTPTTARTNPSNTSMNDRRTSGAVRDTFWGPGRGTVDEGTESALSHQQRLLQPGNGGNPIDVKLFFSGQHAPASCGMVSFTRRPTNLAVSASNASQVILLGHYDRCFNVDSACEDASPVGDVQVSGDGGVSWTCGQAAVPHLARIDSTLLTIQRRIGPAAAPDGGGGGGGGGSSTCATLCMAGGVYGGTLASQTLSAEVWCTQGGDAGHAWGEWVQAADLPSPTRSASVVLVGGVLPLIVGGQRADGSDVIWAATFRTSAPPDPMMSGWWNCVPMGWVALQGTAGVLSHRALMVAADLPVTGAVLLGGGLLLSPPPPALAHNGVIFTPMADAWVLRLNFNASASGVGEVAEGGAPLEGAAGSLTRFPITFPVTASVPAVNDTSWANVAYYGLWQWQSECDQRRVIAMEGNVLGSVCGSLHNSCAC